MSIPKIIHYCWFGGTPLNSLGQKCLHSWHKYCPEYKIVLWDENSFDIKSNVFVEEAYKSRKWAFVSDYVRLYALYHFGGVYMDADFELLKNIDLLLEEQEAFTGYQDYSIPAAIIGAQKGNKWIAELLKYYDNRHFLDKNGNMDLKTNTVIIKEISINSFNFKQGDVFIKKGNVYIYDSIVFFPITKNIFNNTRRYEHDNYYIDEKMTLGIHHGAVSWLDNTLANRLRKFIAGWLRLLLPQKMYSQIRFAMLKKLKLFDDKFDG